MQRIPVARHCPQKTAAGDESGLSSRHAGTPPTRVPLANALVIWWIQKGSNLHSPRGTGVTGRHRFQFRHCIRFNSCPVTGSGNPPYLVADFRSAAVRFFVVELAVSLIWSGRRGSNSRPQPWQGCALPAELLPHNSKMERVKRLELSTSTMATSCSSQLSYTRTVILGEDRYRTARLGPLMARALPLSYFSIGKPFAAAFHLFYGNFQPTRCVVYGAIDPADGFRYAFLTRRRTANLNLASAAAKELLRALPGLASCDCRHDSWYRQAKSILENPRFILSGVASRTRAPSVEGCDWRGTLRHRTL